MNLNQMSPYELGLTADKMAIPYLKKILSSGSLNEKRLAASAIYKLSSKFLNECNGVIPELLTCIRENPHTQTRQYALKALGKLQLLSDSYTLLKEIVETDNKYYNRDIAEKILHSSDQGYSVTQIDIKEMKKEIVLLAKSVKHGHNCIAGREVIRNGTRLRLGAWIRPVSNHDKGAVGTHEMLLEDGSIPQLLDIIEIEISGNAGYPAQPENWLIGDAKWKKTGRLDINSVFDHFIEYPPNLWTGASCQPDRIDTAGYIGNGYNTSICIIKPDTFSMEISTNDFSGRERKQRRGKFSYNGINYDLAITDPEIDKKYFRPFPSIDDETKYVPLNPEKCLLCISLAPDFFGYRYKLIATVIEHE